MRLGGGRLVGAEASLWGPVSAAGAAVIGSVLVYLGRQRAKGEPAPSMDSSLAILQGALEREIEDRAQERRDRNREREEWQKEITRLNQRILDLTGQRPGRSKSSD